MSAVKKQFDRTSKDSFQELKMKSSIGDIYLVASKKGLCGLLLGRQDLFDTHPLDINSLQGQILLQSKNQLEEYFSGERKKFDIPLDLIGTKFQKNVWKALRSIPYGKTSSYKAVAQQIGQPKACRAVGTANGRNPICIIVPCHRVISANGQLGGYTGGVATKKKLLSIESA